MSGTKTGSLDCATFKNHEAVRKSAGHDIGVPFFFVPSFWACKKKVLAIEAKPKLKPNPA